MSKTLTVVLMVMFYVQIHLGSSRHKNWGLIELFNEVRSHKTPIVVERIVNDLMKLLDRPVPQLAANRRWGTGGAKACGRY